MTLVPISLALTLVMAKLLLLLVYLIFRFIALSEARRKKSFGTEKHRRPAPIEQERLLSETTSHGNSNGNTNPAFSPSWPPLPPTVILLWVVTVTLFFVKKIAAST